MKTFTVGSNEAGQRLDKLLHKVLKNAGNGFIYKMIRKRNITLNGKRCEGSEITQIGDEVTFWLSEETFQKFSKTESIQKKEANRFPNNNGSCQCLPALPVIYEDKDILVYNKPAGLLSQKAVSADLSVNDILLAHVPPTPTFTPSIANRLDRNTSGLILCGKTLFGSQKLAEMLRSRSCHKDYLAIVEGELVEACAIRTEVDGKELYSEVRPLGRKGKCSCVMVRLYTGKTHQIRKHLQALGHPIVGDRRYGSGKGAKRQLLHAYRVTFPDGRVVEAPVPEDFEWELGKPEVFEDLPLRI